MTNPSVTISFGRLTGWVLGESLLGPPPVEFPSITGLIARYDFADAATLFTDTARTTPVVSDGDVIKGVTDKSGNANHLSEATNGPAYKTDANGINSKPAALFDGTNDRLGRDTFTQGTIAQPGTVFCVVRTVTINAKQSLYWDSSNDPGSSRWAILQTSASPGVMQWYAGTVQNMGTDASTDARIYVTTYNGAGSDAYTNGGTATTANVGAQSMIGVTLGADNTGGGSNFYHGSIGEWLMYSSELSASDMNSLGAYLSTKWGITWTNV